MRIAPSALVGLTLLVATRAPAQAPREERWQVRARFTLTCVGGAGSEVPGGELAATVPADGPWQEIFALTHQTPAGRIGEVLRDHYGNRYARYRLPRLRPGASVEVGWTAWVRLVAQPRTRWPALSPDLRRRALFRGEPFLCATEPVQALVRRLPRSSAAYPTAAARLLGSELRYAPARSWVVVPQVLARGTASGSEAAYALVALCRARNFPALWAGGTRGPAGDNPPAGSAGADRTGYRWVEVRDARGRWQAIDVALRAKDGRARPVPQRRVLLCRGDGTPGAPLGHHYLTRVDAEPRGGARLRLERAYEWKRLKDLR
jgi:hypothetical protein